METKKISLFPLYLINFIGTLGFSIVLPFLVFLVDDFGGNAIVYGLLGATYSAFQLIGAPILGKMSDKVGRRKILLLSQIGTTIAWVIFLIALFLPIIDFISIESKILGTFILTLPLLTLFFSRALDGITGGNVSVANAYLADISTEENMKKNYGKMSISSNFGFIIGPALAGLLGATIFGAKIPVIIALSVSVIAIFVIAFKLKEADPCKIKNEIKTTNLTKVLGQEQKDCYTLEKEEKSTIKTILKIKNIPFIIFLYFMIFLGFNIFYTAFPIHAIKGLNWSILQMGIYFSTISVVMILVQGPGLKYISKKYSDAFLAIFGSFVLATAFIFLTSQNIFTIYIGVIFFSVGNGVMWPSFMALLSKSAGEVHQGYVQGFASSSGSLASIIGLIAGGFLYEIIGAKTFFVSAVILYFVFILSFRLNKI